MSSKTWRGSPARGGGSVRWAEPIAVAPVPGPERARLRFGHAFRDQLRHQRDEGADDARVERAAGLVLERGERDRFRHGAAIRAIAREGVVVVDDADDPRAERDVLADQAVGIAGAVPALVVRADQRDDRIRERHVRDDLGADARMRLDAGELLGGERARLREDVLRHGQLADVVQQRRGLDAADLALAHAERLGQASGEPLDAAHVLREGVVLGVDGRGKGLDRRQVQVRHLAHLPLLVGQALEVDVVAAIRQQRRHRDGEQQHDRADVAERRHEGGGGGRADDVARRRPQEVGVPHRQRRGAARPGHGQGDERRRDDEVGAGRAGDGQRVGQRHRVERAAEAVVGRAGGGRREHDRGHAEEHLVRRVAAADPERRLAPRAERGGDAREVRSDEEQRREVDGVGEAHRRAAAGQRQPHLEGGADRRHQQQAEEPGHRRDRRRRRRAERQADGGRGHRAGGQPPQPRGQRRPRRAVVTHRGARGDLVPDRTRRSCDTAWRARSRGPWPRPSCSSRWRRARAGCAPSRRTARLTIGDGSPDASGSRPTAENWTSAAPTSRPGADSAARATAFSSSRMLPGQSCFTSRSTASADSVLSSGARLCDVQ